MEWLSLFADDAIHRELVINWRQLPMIPAHRDRFIDLCRSSGISLRRQATSWAADPNVLRHTPCGTKQTHDDAVNLVAGYRVRSFVRDGRGVAVSR